MVFGRDFRILVLFADEADANGGGSFSIAKIICSGASSGIAEECDPDLDAGETEWFAYVGHVGS